MADAECVPLRWQSTRHTVLAAWVDVRSNLIDAVLRRGGLAFLPSPALAVMTPRRSNWTLKVTVPLHIAWVLRPAAAQVLAALGLV